MGANKEECKRVLKHKADRHKVLTRTYKKYEISEEKIAEIEEKQERYEEWLNEVGKME